MPTGAIDVVTLRIICTRYMEKYVTPALEELKTSQESMRQQIQSLQSQSSGGLADQLKELRAKLDMKIDIAAAPTKDEFLELSARVQEGGRGDGMTQELEAMVADLEKNMEELSAALEGKVDVLDNNVALAEINTSLASKVGPVELKRLSTTVDRKANTAKVPSLTQFQELQAQVAGKIDANLVPTVAQVDELAKEVKRRANASDVVTLAQFQRLADELKQKANAGDVVTSDRVEEVVKDRFSVVAANKADAADVPTLAQHKELAAVTERKLAFLAAKVQQQREANGTWNQVQPAVWCMPQLVEASWDEEPQVYSPAA